MFTTPEGVTDDCDSHAEHSYQSKVRLARKFITIMLFDHKSHTLRLGGRGGGREREGEG